MFQQNKLTDNELTSVSGGNKDYELFITADGLELAFTPEYPNVKCPTCGRTGLSAMHEVVDGHLCTMFCNQNCLTRYYVDEMGNLVAYGMNK
ncbi:MAG: hypothetical protein J6V25_07695 [Oscillospiraceae bacterium]|nr:hypothetical protein [Oscillospiraceae bacterium]